MSFLSACTFSVRISSPIPSACTSTMARNRPRPGCRSSARPVARSAAFRSITKSDAASSRSTASSTYGARSCRIGSAAPGATRACARRMDARHGSPGCNASPAGASTWSVSASRKSNPDDSSAPCMARRSNCPPKRRRRRRSHCRAPMVAGGCCSRTAICAATNRGSTGWPKRCATCVCSPSTPMACIGTVGIDPRSSWSAKRIRWRPVRPSMRAGCTWPCPWGAA